MMVTLEARMDRMSQSQPKTLDINRIHAWNRSRDVASIQTWMLRHRRMFRERNTSLAVQLDMLCSASLNYAYQNEWWEGFGLWARWAHGITSFDMSPFLAKAHAERSHSAFDVAWSGANQEAKNGFLLRLHQSGTDPDRVETLWDGLSDWEKPNFLYRLMNSNAPLLRQEMFLGLQGEKMLLRQAHLSLGTGDARVLDRIYQQSPHASVRQVLLEHCEKTGLSLPTVIRERLEPHLRAEQESPVPSRKRI